MSSDNPEIYQERIRHRMREELEAEIRHKFADQLIKALEPTLARDPSIQIVVQLIEDLASA